MKKKLYLIVLFSTFLLSLSAQQRLVPKKGIAENKWIHNQSFDMDWTMLRDTLSIPLGRVSVKVEVSADQVIVITEVDLNKSMSAWIDSTIVKRSDLSPVYHSSYNEQRNMVLHFQDRIHGFYLDKQTGKMTQIEQDVNPGYFDSNFYPTLINWLPLKAGFKSELNIYDYNPMGESGILKVHIRSVKEGIYESRKLGRRKVWVVEVADEIGRKTETTSIYQIDQLTRQLFKQTISSSGRLMNMTLVEN